MAEMPQEPTPTPRWVRVFWGTVAVLFIAFVLAHLTGHGLGAHHHMGPCVCSYGSSC